MTDEPVYDEWLAQRRKDKPSDDFVDRVMAAVDNKVVRHVRYVRLADRMNESRPARWAACLAASLVGSLPFWIVAHAAKMLVF